MNTRSGRQPEDESTMPEVLVSDWQKAGKPLPPPVEILWGVPESAINEADRRLMKVPLPKRKRKRRDDGDKPEPPATP